MCTDSIRGEEEVDFYLASGSPRRRELLRQLGYRFAVLSVDVDESAFAGEEAAAMVLRLASDKAMAGARLLTEQRRLPVLGADTVVVVGDKVLGKPLTCDEALHMLGLLSGCTHHVFTGVALAAAGQLKTVCSETRVTFRELGRAEMQRYWETGEPQDKAGGYALQGLGAIFVERVEGSCSGVVGLPLFETARLLQDAGIDGWQAQRPRNE